MSFGLTAPLSAWVEGPPYTGPILLIGMDTDGWIGIDDVGRLHFIKTSSLTVDIRYDWNSHKWIEVSGIGEEESTDDGSAEFSGSVSDPHGTGDGHQVDEEGGQAAGSPGSLDTGEA